MAYKAGSLFSIPSENVDLYAVWSKYFTASYLKNEGIGSVPDESLYLEGDTVTVQGASNLSKKDHYFSGWLFIGDGEQAIYQENSTFKMPGCDVSLLAQWDKNTYKVLYHSNYDEDKVEDDPDEYTSGTQITLKDQVNPT
jgi:hypothetical protein